MGFMSADERHRQIVEIWTVANEDVGKPMADNFDPLQPDLHDGLLRCPR